MIALLAEELRHFPRIHAFHVSYAFGCQCVLYVYFAKTIICYLMLFYYIWFFCAHPSVVCFVLRLLDCSWWQTLVMAHLPYMMNISVRPHHPEPWRWHHDWETHRHSYSGIVTFRLIRAHPEPGGWIPLTMQTILTLNLSRSNPFTWPPLPPPPREEEDLMDVDLSKDYIF